jgi:surface antigen/peptidoglycan hydrolase CwlO-like protein
MPLKSRKATIITRTFAAIVLGLLVSYTTYPGVKTAVAEASCSSISDCTNQINASNALVKDLKTQAVSYQDAVTRLQSQINTVEAQIADSQRQQADLEQQIADAQNQINVQKSVLADDIRTMYIDGQMTPLEALASSNKLSVYVDKQEYRNAMQNAIQATLARIAKLQADLQTKRALVASLLSQQQSQAEQLNHDKQQQADMLAYNKSQQAAYNSQTAANQAKLSALIAAQRTANNTSTGYTFIRFPGSARDFSPSSYPYANSGFSMSTAPGCNDNDGPDPWGYCTRQCTSYAAWAVQASGRSAPRYWGNAKNWDDRAQAAGIPVYSSPEPGDVAVSNSGTWGHVMYVEAVDGNRIYVSQYNQQLTGQFSYQWRTWK